MSDTQIAEYDPDIRWQKQAVEITLMQWDHSAVFRVSVGGNCHGMDVIDCAIGIIFESLPEDEYGLPKVTLTGPTGDTLPCVDDDERGEDWLKNMIVSAKILGYEPKP